LVEQVMHGHLVLFAALFVESQPTAGTIVIVIVDPEFQYCADPGEAVRGCLKSPEISTLKVRAKDSAQVFGSWNERV
jgi:hypothetical protein